MISEYNPIINKLWLREGGFSVNKKTKAIALTVALGMVVSAAPISVSAASVKTPAKVTLSSVTRTGQKAKVTWKKLKKTPSGYAVYQKRGSSSWTLVKRASKKATSVTVTAKDTEQNQFKVRAYNTYKVKKYYNKKTKKYVNKKAYNKLAKKNRSIKTVTKYKYGKYSSTKALSALKRYTISFDLQDGSKIQAEQVVAGTAIKFDTPTRENYKFVGWYDAAEGGNKVTAAKATGNTTYYAHWKEIIEVKPVVIYSFNPEEIWDDSYRQYMGFGVQISADSKRFAMTKTENGWGKETQNLRFVLERKNSSGDEYTLVDSVLASRSGKNYFEAGIEDYDVDPTQGYTYRVKAVGVTTEGEEISSDYVTITVDKEDFMYEVTDNVVVKEGKRCNDCQCDVTDLSDEDLQSQHGVTYYCSVCGDDPDEGYVSHDRDEIALHIAAAHSSENTETEEKTESETLPSETTTEAEPSVNAEILSRDSTIVNDSDYDITEEKAHYVSWKELDPTTDSEEYTRILEFEGFESAEKIFIDANDMKGDPRYFIIHGVRLPDSDTSESESE